MAMLEIKDIHKTFYTYDDKPRFHIGPFPRGNARRVRSALHVLNGVDLSVEKGDVVAILGPSGSGKTTLLRCLNFLETATQASSPLTVRRSTLPRPAVPTLPGCAKRRPLCSRATICSATRLPCRT